MVVGPDWAGRLSRRRSRTDTAGGRRRRAGRRCCWRWLSRRSCSPAVAAVSASGDRCRAGSRSSTTRCHKRRTQRLISEWRNELDAEGNGPGSSSSSVDRGSHGGGRDSSHVVRRGVWRARQALVRLRQRLDDQPGQRGQLQRRHRCRVRRGRARARRVAGLREGDGGLNGASGAHLFRRRRWRPLDQCVRGRTRGDAGSRHRLRGQLYSPTVRPASPISSNRTSP